MEKKKEQYAQYIKLNRSSDWWEYERSLGAAPSTCYAHNPLWGSEKNEHQGLEKILNWYNILCSCNPKECKLKESDHFPIIILDDREVFTKQQQRWSIESANWMQFQRESTITTKVRDQNTIEEAYSWLNKCILQVVEKTIPKTSSEVKRRPPVACWKEECKRKERIAWKDRRDSANN